MITSCPAYGFDVQKSLQTNFIENNHEMFSLSRGVKLNQAKESSDEDRTFGAAPGDFKVKLK